VNTRQRWTLIAAVLGSSIVFVDSSVVTVALPRICRELQTTIFGVLEGQLYVYMGYLLTLSALLILAGALSDFYGSAATMRRAARQRRADDRTYPRTPEP